MSAAWNVPLVGTRHALQFAGLRVALSARLLIEKTRTNFAGQSPKLSAGFLFFK